MDHVSLLKKMVSIGSVYPAEGQICRELEEVLSKLGFVVGKVPVNRKRVNLLAEKNKGSKAILFYGHMDTVPVVEGWSRNPFDPIVVNERLYGLGSYDMKGGIAAFLSAVAETDAYIKVLLAVDEENISEGAWKVVQQKPDFFDDVELVVSAEPNFEWGMNGITRGRTGRCVFRVDFEGKAAHIAKYKEGVDAIELAAEFVSRLYGQREKMYKSPKTVVQVRKMIGESVGMSVCGMATAEVEVLLGVEDRIEGVEKKLSSLLDSAKVTLKARKTPYLEGYYFESFPYQGVIEGIIKEFTGKEMKLHERSSVGDDNVLASLGIPVITWGPDGGGAHQADEYVDLDSVRKLSIMFKALLNKVG